MRQRARLPGSGPRRLALGRKGEERATRGADAATLANPRALAQSSFMRRLFLVRHAKAKPSVGRDDYARKLTKRGRADAKRVAKALAARHFLPDVLIHSGAARAKETAEIFAAKWRSKSSLKKRLGFTTRPSRRYSTARGRSPTRTSAWVWSGTIPGSASWRRR